MSNIINVVGGKAPDFPLKRSVVGNGAGIASRLIPTLAGSQYGTIDTVITFTGDFEIESKIAMTNGATGTFQIVTGASTTADYQGVSATGVLTAKIDGSTLSSAPVTVTPFDGKIHTWILSRVGSVGTLTIDGVVQFTGAVGATDSVWEMFGANILPTAVNLFQGQILSIKFTDAGTVVADYVFDSGSTTDQPSRSGSNNVSLINFATTDWSRYTLQRNILHDAGTITEAWVGDSLITGDDSRFNTGLGNWVPQTTSLLTWQAGSKDLFIDRNSNASTNTHAEIVAAPGFIIGDRYIYSLNVKQNSNGISFGSTLADSSVLLTTGTFSFVFNASVTSERIRIGARNSLTATLTVDDVLVSKLLEVA